MTPLWDPRASSSAPDLPDPEQSKAIISQWYGDCETQTLYHNVVRVYHRNATVNDHELGVECPEHGPVIVLSQSGPTHVAVTVHIPSLLGSHSGFDQDVVIPDPPSL